jgi:hypothetical protein
VAGVASVPCSVSCSGVTASRLQKRIETGPERR